MPVYEFACPACDERFEELVRRFEDPVACPSCGEREVERRLSVFAPSARAATVPDYSRLAHHARPVAGGCCGGACGHAH